MPDRRRPSGIDSERRRMLQRALVASGVLAAGPGLWNSTVYGGPLMPRKRPRAVSDIPRLAGTLHEVRVANDPQTRMRIPRGFSVREVARTGVPPVPGAAYCWPGNPDGGAAFAMPDGGWVYCSNSEMGRSGEGSVGALRFNARGEPVDSYAICTGTTNNCAGGPTPWGTWLSCEEIDFGLVYECDPAGQVPARAVPALGAFRHEAAAVDPVHKHIYLTEDTPDGNLYRFVPVHYPDGGRADLARGRLEVAVVSGEDPLASRPVRWAAVPDPVPAGEARPGGHGTPTRRQVAGAARFDGGEGCWYHQGMVYFTSKGDNRVWALDTSRGLLDCVYDKRTQHAFNPGMDDVDNLTVSAAGDIVVAEDGDGMRLVVVGPGVRPFELVHIPGHRDSEITGPAFSPDGSRLYFSSQKGAAGNSRDGRTYEIKGPFFT